MQSRININVPVITNQKWKLGNYTHYHRTHDSVWSNLEAFVLKILVFLVLLVLLLLLLLLLTKWRNKGYWCYWDDLWIFGQVTLSLSYRAISRLYPTRNPLSSIPTWCWYPKHGNSEEIDLSGSIFWPIQLLQWIISDSEVDLVTLNQFWDQMGFTWPLSWPADPETWRSRWYIPLIIT